MTKASFEEQVLSQLKQRATGFANAERKSAIMQADVADVHKGSTMQRLHFSTLQADLKESLGRIRAMEDWQTSTQTVINNFSEEARKLGVTQEVIIEKIDQLIEAVIPEMEKTTTHDLRLGKHDETLQRHDGRLRMLEKSA